MERTEDGITEARQIPVAMAENHLDGIVETLDARESVIFAHPRFTLDTVTRTVALQDGKVKRLTQVESRFLQVLMQRPNTVLGRQGIAIEALGSEYVIPRWADVYVCRLRKKLEDFQDDNPIIETMNSRGYRLNNLLIPKEDSTYRHPFFDFDRDADQLIIDGNVIKLAHQEADILKKLSERSNEFVSHKELRESVENWASIGEDALSSRYLHVYISKLRVKIKSGRILPPIITKFQQGYMLVDQTSASDAN